MFLTFSVWQSKRLEPVHPEASGRPSKHIRLYPKEKFVPIKVHRKLEEENQQLKQENEKLKGELDSLRQRLSEETGP